MGNDGAEEGQEGKTSGRVFDRLDKIMEKLNGIDLKVNKIPEIQSSVESLNNKMSKLESIVEGHEHKLKQADDSMYEVYIDLEDTK